MIPQKAFFRSHIPGYRRLRSGATIGILHPTRDLTTYIGKLVRSNLFGEVNEVQSLVLEHIIPFLYIHCAYTLLLLHTQAARSVLFYMRNQSHMTIPIPRLHEGFHLQ